MPSAAMNRTVRLGPLHGVDVRLVPPGYSPHTCRRCWIRSGRPRPGMLFVCATCGDTEDSEVNAARVHHGRALNGWLEGVLHA